MNRQQQKRKRRNLRSKTKRRLVRKLGASYATRTGVWKALRASEPGSVERLVLRRMLAGTMATETCTGLS